jgi:nucleoside 2-deoxyribosyltransferase
MMRVYVAAPWAHKLDARVVVKQLRDAGVRVSSRWIEREETEYECAPELMRSEAQRDIEDIIDSHALLYLNLAKSEGKATELGMAIWRGIPIYCVGGTQNNVFLHLPEITHLASVEAFIEGIR